MENSKHPSFKRDEPKTVRYLKIDVGSMFCTQWDTLSYLFIFFIYFFANAIAQS